ncbi:MAG: GntR family transcriptional regulator [Tumebacillaceae bacterium]
MWFNVDQRSSVPIYQQIVHGVKEAVAKGVLVQGDKLPSVRELAGQITINHNTIAKAYQELEREGIIETLRGRGTFVAAVETRVLGEEKRMMIKGMLEKILVEAFHMQVEEQELLDLLNETVRDWYQERREQQ